MPFLAGLPALLSIALAFSLTLPALALDPARQGDRKAQEIFDQGQRLELQGRLSSALAKYRLVLKHFRRSRIAPTAQFRIGYLYQSNKEYEKAFNAYQKVITDFRASDLFLPALRAEYELASDALRKTTYLKRNPRAQLPFELPEPEVIRNMLRVILTNAKHSEFAPKTCFLIAASYHQEGDLEAARNALGIILDDYASSDYVDDADFQIAYLDYLEGIEEGAHHVTLESAQLAFEYFIIQHPKSDKVPEARHLLRRIDRIRLRSLVKAAAYYREKGKPTSVAVYEAAAQRLLAEMEGDDLPSDIQDLMPAPETNPEAGEPVDASEERRFPRIPRGWSPLKRDRNAP